MKVVTPAEMARIESLAYSEGFSPEEFMEAAGQGIAQFVHSFIEKHKVANNIILLCGKGNNGGDAYVAGLYLLQYGCSVRAYQMGEEVSFSPLCKKNQERFKAAGGEVVVANLANIAFPADGIIVDGIFGTGFRGAVDGIFSDAIVAANKSHLPIIAIDIPSGLNGDTGAVESVAIKAMVTVFLGFPKRGFFLHSGWDYIGKLTYVNFGLPLKFFEAVESSMTLFTPEMFSGMLPEMKRSRHKYEAGYVVGLAGSPGMPGAANLSCEAALRGGAGIVRLLYPKGMESELSASMYELIKTGYEREEGVEKLVEAFNKATAVFIGPGIGVNDTTRELVRAALPLVKKPSVLDADALNILSEEMVTLPKETIMTPHIGEMRRLLHSNEKGPVTVEFLQQCYGYAEKMKVTLILKGGPTFILQGGHSYVVNAYGDPGMATAGSGDVLTGLVAALLAQGLPAFNAAVLGSYLHAVAGERAAEEKTSYCMTASDIIRHFPDVFKMLL